MYYFVSDYPKGNPDVATRPSPVKVFPKEIKVTFTPIGEWDQEGLAKLIALIKQGDK